MNRYKILQNELPTISLIDIERYLEEQGWNKYKDLNDKIKLFRGPNNDEGKPLELMLPKSNQYEDYYYRILDVINILANVSDKKIEQVIKEITLVSHDVLKMRVINNGKYSNSIPLRQAADDVNALKKLFVFGASSEKKNLPHFDSPLDAGLQHAELCQFGHTFQGSFGFTINSPIISDYEQLKLFQCEEDSPFERRVLERIIRGLSLVEESAKKDDADLVINNFDIALNSRMCEAILEMSQKYTCGIEFCISWSPKIRVPQEIKDKDKWFLDKAEYRVLEYAAEQLKKVEPFVETIIGQIVTLHSTKNPMSEENFPRQAIVKHDYEGRRIDVKLYLDKEGYNLAYEAHGMGLPVMVEGKLFRKGTTWKMIEIKKLGIYYG